MKTYRFLYVREQRHRFYIDAEDLGTAQDKAQSYIQTLDLGSPDDQSDDPGEIEEVKE